MTDGLVGFWNFNEGTGTVVHDTSGNGTPLDLTIADPAKTQWTPDGLTLLQSTRVQTSGAATKLITAAKATNAFTLETWTTAANTTQGSPARIAAIAKDPWSRNVELGPDATRFLGRVRTSLAASTDLPTPTGLATTAPTHLALVRQTDGVTRLYVNGVQQATATTWGTLANWDATMRLVFGNVPTGNDRPFLGQLHLTAFYNKALTPAEITQNLDAGPRGTASLAAASASGASASSGPAPVASFASLNSAPGVPVSSEVAEKVKQLGWYCVL